MIREVIEYSFIIVAFIIILVISTRGEKEVDEFVDVVVTKHEIQEGKVLEQTDFIYNDIPREYLSDGYIKSIKELLGERAKVSISSNTIMTDNYICKAEDVMKNNDIMYNNIVLQDDIRKGDKIDIRIKVNEIEDYLVLSDKTIIERTDNKIWLNLSMMEQGEILKAIEKIEAGCVVYTEKKGEIGD